MAEIPADIILNLQKSNLLGVFSNLPPSHQSEYLKWIDEAKKPETRRRRIMKMCVMLQGT